MSVEITYAELVRARRSLEEYYVTAQRSRSQLVKAQALSAPGQINAAGPTMVFVSEVGRLSQRSHELGLQLDLALKLLQETEHQLLTEIPDLPRPPHPLQIFSDAGDRVLASLMLSSIALGGLAITTVSLGASALTQLLRFQAEVFSRAAQHFAYRPVEMFLPGGVLGALFGSTIRNLHDRDMTATSTQFWVDSFHNVEGILALGGEHYERVLSLATGALAKWDIHDRAELSTASRVSAEQQTVRRLEYHEYLQQFPEILAADRTDHIQPENLSELLLGLGQIDFLGGEDEAVIRLGVMEDHPEKLILMFPSTQNWLPGSGQPNDLLGNLMALQGMSALVGLGDEAVIAYQEAHPEVSAIDLEILVAGFSQGGIAAAAFATAFQDSYRIRQVVTAGAPIGTFDRLPDRTRVLALEAEDDPVPKLDGRKNPDTPQWKTVQMRRGLGSAFGAHHIAEYAAAASALESQEYLNDGLASFLGKNYEFTDFYGHRDTSSGVSTW